MEVNVMSLNIYVIHKFSQEGKIANNRMLNPSYGYFNFHYEKILPFKEGNYNSSHIKCRQML